jgi:signal transduction histidine kinase
MKAKHILLSLVLLILGVSSSVAQDTLLINPAKIDSLQQLIDSRSRADEEKVRLLNEYARLCFYNQEYLKGFIATRDARELSKKLNFKGGEIMYYVTLAAFTGEGEMYTYYLQQAKNIVIKANNQFSEYNTELDIPTGYPPKREQLLLDNLIPVLHFFEQQDDKEIQLAIMEPIAWSYYNLGRFDELKTILKRIIELNSNLNQLYPKFLAYTRLSSLLNFEGKIEEAKKIEKETIELLSKENGNSENGFLNYIQAENYNNTGQYALAIDYYLKSADAFESTGDLNMLTNIYNQLGYAYEQLDMQAKALEIYEKYIPLFKKSKDDVGLHNAYNRPVFPLYELKRYEEARKYMAMSLQGSEGQNKILLQAKSNSLEGQILMDEGKYKEAITYLHKTYETYSKLEDDNGAKYTISFTLLYLTECYQKIGDMKTALKYALECLEKENKLNHKRTGVKSKISFLIADIYIETGKAEKAFYFLKLYREIAAEQNKTESANKVAEAEIRSIIDKSEKQINLLEKDKIQKIQQSKIQRVWIFSITGALLSALLVAFILYRNNKNKQKANAQLKSQKEKVENTLEQLKSTQTQLIQSEKMASLGELTAGIAHEIQNPLNFVNNFSEINKELIDELKEELAVGNMQLANEIAGDIKQNLEKINHHGKRADAIVKGMLQHSRTSTGQKEPTDINALADEYLRLAYHGLRAKDKTFNADFKTDLDPTLPKINVIPQDIGRVLLNLINNAFYAVDKRAKENVEGYKPEVVVSTSSSPFEKGGIKGGLNDVVTITVSDNGPGIPSHIVDKIFQPFFTTKPTGQGTGLGLSLSYDIAKAHGGEIRVESKPARAGSDGEGEGSEFIIQIPIN